MKVRIDHLTRHTYQNPVSFSEHALFLRPLDSHRRHVDHFQVQTVPECRQRWVRDAYGNLVLMCNFDLQESPLLEFKTAMEVSLTEDNPFEFLLEPYAATFPFEYSELDRHALLPFLKRKPVRGSLEVLAWFDRAVPPPDRHAATVPFLADLNEAIRRDITYVRRDEDGIQAPDTTLQLRSGSCRDMAVLLIAIARQLGLAARFVSGYLYDPPPGTTNELSFNRAVGSMHAWAEVYLPGAGWKGFDPTNGILANSFFIPCGVSHEPVAVSPIQGRYFSQATVASTLEVALEVHQIAQD